MMYRLNRLETKIAPVPPQRLREVDTSEFQNNRLSQSAQAGGAV